MAIQVNQPGVLTTVQDLGRYGYQKLGIPVSGVMDTEAYRTANALVGNCRGEAVLEMTLWGGSYTFDAAAEIALTGADMQPKLDGRPIPSYKKVSVPAGAKLDLSMAVSGCRTYLAVRGGIDVPVVMGSRSTYRKCAIGGFEGRELRPGDVVKVGSEERPGVEALTEKGDLPGGASNAGAPEKTAAPSCSRPVYSDHITVRVIPGPQDGAFTEKGKADFYGSEYTVSQQSDRMGCRLEGPAVESVHGTDIISDGIVFGAIQVTGSGQPIVLMADRQTAGGYAKIAVVITEDLPLLAQAKPGSKVRFRAV